MEASPYTKKKHTHTHMSVFVCVPAWEKANVKQMMLLMFLKVLQITVKNLWFSLGKKKHYQDDDKNDNDPHHRYHYLHYGNETSTSLFELLEIIAESPLTLVLLS